MAIWRFRCTVPAEVVLTRRPVPGLTVTVDPDRRISVVSGAVKAGDAIAALTAGLAAVRAAGWGVVEVTARMRVEVEEAGRLIGRTRTLAADADAG